MSHKRGFSKTPLAQALQQAGIDYRHLRALGCPKAIRDRYPDLVAEVPQTFERTIQGRAPLMRVGWAMMRPANTPPAAPQ